MQEQEYNPAPSPRTVLVYQHQQEFFKKSHITIVSNHDSEVTWGRDQLSKKM